MGMSGREIPETAINILLQQGVLKQVSDESSRMGEKESPARTVQQQLCDNLKLNLFIDWFLTNMVTYASPR